MLHTKVELDKTYMQNRELSWMTFNKRVLEEAMEESVPLLERLKFISIFLSNFDEFFMIRVGSLTDLQCMGNKSIDNKTGMSPKEQLNHIFNYAVLLYQLCNNTYQVVESKLREYGIYNLELQELSNNDKKYVDKIYDHDILPILSPLLIDLRHPFPHLVNKGLYIVCSFAEKNKMFGLVPVSASLSKFYQLPGSQMRYILTEKIILDKISEIFSMYKIESAAIISVTRNADISPDDEVFEENDNFDYKDMMKKLLKKRGRLAPVRLEVQGSIHKDVLEFLMDKLDINSHQVLEAKFPIAMDYVFGLCSKIQQPLRKELSYPDFEAVWPENINKSQSITSQCKEKDIVLFYPYHSMEPFLRLLKESAEDSNVISIKLTIYRLARNSRIVDCLCNAAENGKEVTVLMELKARFDEKNNIEWAEQLEQAGCNIIYGFEGFKVHTKICLITRREKNEIVYITQIGTGNYNEKTSKIYTDFSLITASDEIGIDANNFFRNMSISNLHGDYNQFMVAPYSFKNHLFVLMDREITKARQGEHGKIIIKSNSLTDKEIINKLVMASQAGVEITLIIRGICCLLPGVEGVTDRIQVVSIVGRFLEHARVYCFGNDNDMSMYIASADLMTRNTSKRVEIACPILDKQAKKGIYHILEMMIKDNVQGRHLSLNGCYKKVNNDLEISINSQQYFTYNINSILKMQSNVTVSVTKTRMKRYVQSLKSTIKSIMRHLQTS